MIFANSLDLNLGDIAQCYLKSILEHNNLLFTKMIHSLVVKNNVKVEVLVLLAKP